MPLTHRELAAICLNWRGTDAEWLSYRETAMRRIHAASQGRGLVV